MKYLVWFCMALLPVALQAQRGFAFRLGADFNSIANADRYPVVSGTFGNLVLGASYKSFNKRGGAEVGLNFLWKEKQGSTLYLPGAMMDQGNEQSTALGAVEFDLRVGPRFGVFYPKLGIRAGYRMRAQDLIVQKTLPVLDYQVNRLYATIPLGFSIELPTNFGTTGFSLLYNIAITNFVRNPDGRPGWDGGNLRSLYFDLHVMIGESGSGTSRLDKRIKRRRR